MRRAGAATRTATCTTAPERAHDLGNACDLGQTGRGRDIVMALRPRLEGLASRHLFFWCRGLAEVRSKKSLVVT